MRKIKRAMLITHILFHEKLRHRKCSVDLIKNDGTLVILYIKL